MARSKAQQDLYDSGRRAAGRSYCQSVLVAPDHTGEDNYHNCMALKRGYAGDTHVCGCYYEWDDLGQILIDPFASTKEGPA